MTASTPLRTATVDTAALAAVTAQLARVIERRNTIPVLGTVRMTLARNTATLEGTDLDNLVKMSFEIDGPRQPIAAVVQPRVFHLARQFGARLTVTDQGEGVLAFGGEFGEARVRCFIPVDDWPETVLPAGDETTIGEGALHKALSLCLDTVSTEETRYYLNGVYLHEREGRLRAASTDGHRLTLVDFDDEAWTTPPAILPRKAASLLLRQLRRDGNRTVAVVHEAERRRMTFRVGDCFQFSKTIDGTYPDYTRVMPRVETPTIRAIIAREQVARLGPFERDSACIRIDPEGARMERVDRERDFTVAVPIQKGEGPAFAVNLRHLRDLTRHGTVRITGNRPSDPMLVVDDDPAVTRVQMPMRLP